MSGPLNLEQILTFLMDTPMFRDLDPTELSEIVHILQVRHIRQGHKVFSEGEAGDAWYIVYEGDVDVLKDSGLGLERLARLGPRACFGEMSILDGSARSATVLAVGDVSVLRFPRLEFQDLLRSGNLAAYKLVLQMALVLVGRQRSTTSRLTTLLKLNQDILVREGLTPIVEIFSSSE